MHSSSQSWIIAAQAFKHLWPWEGKPELKPQPDCPLLVQKACISQRTPYGCTMPEATSLHDMHSTLRLWHGKASLSCAMKGLQSLREPCLCHDKAVLAHHAEANLICYDAGVACSDVCKGACMHQDCRLLQCLHQGRLQGVPHEHSQSPSQAQIISCHSLACTSCIVWSTPFELISDLDNIPIFCFVAMVYYLAFLA